jgi:hypothetical protein
MSKDSPIERFIDSLVGFDGRLRASRGAAGAVRRCASDICRAGDDGDLTVDELIAVLLRRLSELVVDSQRAIEVVGELAGTGAARGKAR